MKFKGPSGFERTVSLQINLIVGMIVSACVLSTVNGVPTTPEALRNMALPWVQSTLLSFFVGFTMTDFLPTMDWGQALVRTLKVRNPVGTHLIISTVIGSIMGTCILVFCSIINNITSGSALVIVSFFLSVYHVVLLGAVGTVIVFLKPVTAVAQRVSGFSPAAATEAAKAAAATTPAAPPATPTPKD